MPYSLGSIVWYKKTSDDPDITYPGDDPCAATVHFVHSPDLADLKIMVDNKNPVIRTNVPLVTAEEIPASGHFAMEDREYWAEQ